MVTWNERQILVRRARAAAIENDWLGGMWLHEHEAHWGVLRYLIYFSQVGITVVTPPVLCCFGAVWLRDRLGWGNGVVIVGIMLGIAVAACGLRDILRFTERKAREREKEERLP